MKIRTYRILSSTRLGSRGAVLLVLAAIDVLFGAVLVYPPVEQLHSSAYLWRDHIMPTQVWGMIWIAVGVIVGANAFVRQDRVGYGFAIAIKIAWAFLALISAISGAVPGAWASVIVWGLAAVWVIIDSGRSETMHTREVTVLDADERNGE